MKIKTLIQNLEAKIDKNLIDLSNLGKECKSILESDTPQAEKDSLLDKNYNKMIKIALDLEPALKIMNFDNPKLEMLIYDLLQLHNQSNQKDVQ